MPGGEVTPAGNPRKEVCVNLCKLNSVFDTGTQPTEVGQFVVEFGAARIFACLGSQQRLSASIRIETSTVTNDTSSDTHWSRRLTLGDLIGRVRRAAARSHEFFRHFIKTLPDVISRQ
jgi:hypothetical protein